MPDDLWPDDLAELEAPDPPVAILREQAGLLGKHTGDVVNGSVATLGMHGDQFRYSFDLWVPMLQYRFTLFVLEYGAEGYPAAIHIERRISTELQLQPSAGGMSEIIVRSDEELTAALKAIFATKRTKGVLSALVGQARSGR